MNRSLLPCAGICRYDFSKHFFSLREINLPNENNQVDDFL